MTMPKQPALTLADQLDAAHLAFARGDADAVVTICVDLLRHWPRQPDALLMLAQSWLVMGHFDKAEVPIVLLLQDDSHNARAHYALACIRRAQARHGEAAMAARQAVAIDPSIFEAWHSGGIALMQAGRSEEAVDFLRLAVVALPNKAALHGCLSLALLTTGDLDQAGEEAQKALSLDKNDTDALMADLSLTQALGDYELLLQKCAAAQALYPQLEKVLGYMKGDALLVTGRYIEGYATVENARIGHDINVRPPLWDGKPAPDKHIVLYGEQGFGDILHFVRFVPRVVALVGCVTLRVPRQLERLLRHSMPDIALSVYDPPMTAKRQALESIRDPLLDFPADADLRASLLSLAHLLGLGSQTDAASIPYLRTDRDTQIYWAKKLSDKPHPRIGLIWAGSPQHGNDHNRSMSFSMLQPLLDVLHGHFVSLQIGQAAQANAGLIDDITDEIIDFADTAAILANIDLLITVDTSAAHLAGAMGVPCWLMLPFVPDWRWLLRRADSPWYPSLRLFRQPKPGDWASVVDAIRAELQ